MNCLLSDIRVNTFDLFFFSVQASIYCRRRILANAFFSTIVAFLHKVNIFLSCLVTFVLWFTNPYPIKLVCAKNRTKSCAAEVLVDVFGG